MKKFLSSVFVVLTLTGSSYALTDLQACINQNDAKNYQAAVKYGKKAVREYPKNPSAYVCLAQAYDGTGQRDKAIENLKKASRYTSNDHALMYTYDWLGSEYELKGDYPNAILYYSKSLKLSKRLGNVDAEEGNLNNIANVFKEEGNYSKALEYYKKVLELKNGKSETGTIYKNIALIYFDMNNYNKSIEYLKKVVDMAEEHGNYLKSGKYMLNLGIEYLLAKDFKNAKLYFEKGLERVKKVGNKRWEGMGYEYFGLYYEDTDNKALAKEYLTKAYNIFKAIGDNKDASVSMRYLSSIK